MYRYDHYDQAMVDTRVEEFRDQARRRLEGKLTEDQFKPLRLMNGLYLQLHAYMLRVAIPYGTLDARQMRALADIAAKYDRGYGHFTTRQNIQYNWIKLEECADLLADLATVEMHAIQTSGNCIRNISADLFAGAAADEIADPRPYAELLRQWSSFHPEFSAPAAQIQDRGYRQRTRTGRRCACTISASASSKGTANWARPFTSAAAWAAPRWWRPAFASSCRSTSS